MFTGMVGQVVGGLGDAGQLLGAEVFTGMVPGWLRQDKTTYTGMAIQGGAGVLLAWAVRQFRIPILNPRLMVAGAMLGPARALIRQWNIPFLAPALGQEPTYREIGAYPQLEAYPEPGLSQEVDIYGTSAYTQ